MINILYTVDPIKRIVKPVSGHAVTEQDHEASSLRFAFPDNIAGTGLDSTGTAVRVMYIRPDGGDPVAKTLTFYKHSGGYYLYDWDLQKSDLSKEGALVFSLCILDISDGEVSEWHTTPYQISVLNTIHTDDSDEGDESITPTVAQRVAVLEAMIQRVASGAPIVVESTSAMTDTGQIYVLSTDGMWYYHDGSAWVAGGEYGAVSTDTTLSQSGIPADAKKVGDELTGIKADLDDVNESLQYADALNQLALVANLRNVVSGLNSVQKFHAPATRGSMTTAGEIQSHTKRCIIKYSGVSIGNKLYFDASVYKIYVVYFYQGERVGSTGWQTTSPFVLAVLNSDCVYVVVERLDTTVVNIENAIKNIYFEYTASSDLATRKVKYVSLSGNDSASGDATHPLLTVNKALEMGAEMVNISAGTYEQQIDLSKSKNGIVQLNNYSATGNVIFTPANRTVVTSETLVDGYTKVYSAPCSIEFASSNVWLFQENASDTRTVISNAERLPQQRGLYYRCYDTKIEKCTSASLSDALAEIESTDDYKWFVDNGTIYFSRPNTVSSSAPIRYSDGSLLFLNANRSHTIIANGIATRYMSFNIDDTTNSELVDCKSTNVYGDGAFTYDNAIGAKLIRCEASRCFNGNVGDGINAHGQTGGTTSSKKTTAMIIDCWSHDNKDDGFSDHECCESVIDGGLFEYNGKAGITPSYGAHCVCKNVVSRQNYNGFYVTGQATQAEGGAYTQLLCFNCVSENNQRGSSNKAGYLTESNNNRMILVDCKSIGNRIGYYCTGGTLMTAIDCTSLSDNIVKTGGGTLTVQTGTVLSS